MSYAWCHSAVLELVDSPALGKSSKTSFFRKKYAFPLFVQAIPVVSVMANVNLLSYGFRQDCQVIVGGMRGIAIPNVNASKLEGFDFPLAPSREQERIVAKAGRAAVAGGREAGCPNSR